MNIFNQQTSLSAASRPRSSLTLSSSSTMSSSSSSVDSFFSLASLTAASRDSSAPLPALFSNVACLDMPTLLDSLAGQEGEVILEEAGDTSQPVVYEEVIDFFVSATDPSKVFISRSGDPSSTPILPVSSYSGDLSNDSAVTLPPRPQQRQQQQQQPQQRRQQQQDDVSCSLTFPPASHATRGHASGIGHLSGGVEQKLAIKRERNRRAAERCRARRVNLIASLQAECDRLRIEKERLLKENKMLVEALSIVKRSTTELGA